MGMEDVERDVLAAARRALSPTDADRERVRRLTETAVRTAGTGEPTPPRAGFSTRALPWAARAIFVGVIAAVAAGLGYRAGWRAATSRLASATSEAAPAVVLASANVSKPPVTVLSPPSPLPASSAAAISPEARAVPSVAAPRRRVAAEPSSPATSLDAEVRALRAVERALREHDPGFALTLLRELDRTVPNGRLVEEREAVSAIARCVSGDVPFGLNLADDFVGHHPDSVYGRRVIGACAATDAPPAGDKRGRRSSSP
jgi:hypothetical protein